MTKYLRTAAVMTLAASLAGAMSMAQSSGDAIYKAKCQTCHGATGTPSPGMQKMMGVKPASEYKSLSAAQIEATVKNGKGKMRPIAGLSDAQVKAVA
ncbi:MAG: c-type cytochrome, partial [Acidobacteriota bacterium]